MRLPRTGSLTALLSLGLLLLVLPLAAAVVQGAVQLRGLSQATDVLVHEAVDLTRHTQSLFQQLAAYERTASLFVLLRDERLLEASRANRQHMVDTLDQLSRLPLDDAGREQLAQLRRQATDILALLESADAGDATLANSLGERLAELNEAAAAHSTHANELLQQRLATLEERNAATRDRLMLWLVALVPAALLLGAILVLGILRPLRRVDQAIARLGRGVFSQQVSITGPSDIGALGRQLEWLRVRLLGLAQEKNRFLRHMSHELKTPLANVREGTDLLLDGALGEVAAEQREVLDILRENALRLQQLIENLLSYSAWQSQAGGIDLSTFPLDAVIRSSVEAQRLSIAARKIDVRLALQAIEMRADRAKLRLVFDNLLSNSLKFTPPGGAVNIAAVRHGAHVMIDFSDTGPGIPPSERAWIFDAFYTGSMPQAGPMPGTGVGLSIVVEFVAAHGGRVELVSSDSPGAHFRIHLPLSAQAAEPRREEPHA